METVSDIKKEFENTGYSVIENIYSEKEINQLLEIISQADSSNSTFRKSREVFAIRQFVREVPGSIDLIFNKNLIHFITSLFGKKFFLVKSIYFDKPATSNWFVAYHQDLTISVDKKIEIEGYGPWTTKQNQFAVQPPLEILQDNFTIRIHLDETNANNGALKVIPGSHQKKIYRVENINWEDESESTCSVTRGGIMLMKPLLFHSSGRTTNNCRRRVIHLEFSRSSLPGALMWAEYLPLNASH